MRTTEAQRTALREGAWRSFAPNVLDRVIADLLRDIEEAHAAGKREGLEAAAKMADAHLCTHEQLNDRTDIHTDLGNLRAERHTTAQDIAEGIRDLIQAQEKKP